MGLHSPKCLQINTASNLQDLSKPIADLSLRQILEECVVNDSVDRLMVATKTVLEPVPIHSNTV